MENVCERGSRLRSVSEKCWGATNYYSGKEAVLRGYSRPVWLCWHALSGIFFNQSAVFLPCYAYVKFGGANKVHYGICASGTSKIYWMSNEKKFLQWIWSCWCQRPDCICLTHGSIYPVNTEPNYRNPQNTGFVWGKIIFFASYENERI